MMITNSIIALCNIYGFVTSLKKEPLPVAVPVP